MRVLLQIARDLQIAIRSVVRAPGMSAVVVASIAVGIGANATVFSWIQARILKPIPGVERGRDYYLIEPRSDTRYAGSSWLEYRDAVEQLSALDSVIAFRMAPLNVGAGDWSERTYGTFVSGNYFSGLGLTAEKGRLISSADTVSPGGTSVVVVSHRFWRARLDGNPEVIGQPLRLNDRVFNIVGVAPPRFQGTVMGLTFDLWIPATASTVVSPGTKELDSRALRDYDVMGRLRPGATFADGQRDLDALMRRLAEAYPKTNSNIRAELLPQWNAPQGPQRSLMAALALLQALTLLVLAAVVGNTTTLVLARATTRQRETAIRLALGAARWRVMSLVLTEQFLLGVAGAALGALVAVWGTNAMRAVPMPTPAGLEVTFFTDVDTVTLVFAMILGLLSGLAIGLPAAWQLSRGNPHAVLRAGGTVGGRHRLRDILVAIEVALAMVVLVVAAMFLRGFTRTQVDDTGFRRDGVLLAAYDLRGRAQDVSPAKAREFANRLLDRLQRVPSVESAALATSVPLDIHGLPSRSFTLEGHARADGTKEQALTNSVSPGYLRTMAIPIVRGTDFAALDDTAAAPQAIVNEEFARRYRDAGDALGRRIETAGRTFVIVGIAKNSLYNAFGEPPTPFIYLSLRDVPTASAEIHARMRGNVTDAPESISNDLRRAVRDVDETLPLYNVRSLNRHVESNLFFQRVPARLFLVLGPVVLALVALGIYAVGSHAVGERRAEIATRIALGATTDRVTRLMIGESIRLVGFGMCAGAVVALLIDPAALGGPWTELLLVACVATVFLAVAVAASFAPARRAARLAPIIALKEN
jgi:putative ABC transport system permease protein